MIEEEIRVNQLATAKLEYVRELLWSHCFYGESHRELIKDHISHAAAILGDVIDLLGENDTTPDRISKIIASAYTQQSNCFKMQPAKE